jgi:hypothetical protein
LLSEYAIATSWSSETVYFCALAAAIVLAWRLEVLGVRGVVNSSLCAASQSMKEVLLPKLVSSDDGFSLRRCLNSWLRLRRRVMGIDQQPLLG